MQPGGWSLECADVRSGQLIWRQVLPELRRLLGVVRGRLLAATSAELIALDPSSGKLLWSRAARPAERDHADRRRRSDRDVRVGTGAGLRRRAAEAGVARRGHRRRVHTALLRLPSANAVQSGPLVFAAGRCWGFFAEPNSFVREIVELTPGQ